MLPRGKPELAVELKFDAVDLDGDEPDGHVDGPAVVELASGSE